MARPWRIQFPEATYHVMARGNNLQNVFLDDTDRKDFLDLITKAAKRYNLTIFAFCLMSNHYHLFFQTPDANLSSAMQWINGTYTVRFRIRKGFKGHLFQGRFKAKLVAEPEYFDQLSFYLHLNPVLAGLVKTPEEYEWSSYRDYISAKPRFEWLDRDALLSQFGRSRYARIRSYRKACLSHIDKRPEFWNKLIDPVVIGSAGAVDKLVKKYAPKGNPKPVTDYQLLRSSVHDPDHELEKVADIFGVDVSKLKERRRAMPAKLAAYAHLVENCGMRPGQAAKYFMVSSSAVSKGVSRFKQMIFNDLALEIKYAELVSE